MGRTAPEIEESFCSEPPTRIREPLKLSRSPLPHALSYWAQTAGAEPRSHGKLVGDTQADVAVIGAGYTGLSTAYHLTKDYGISTAVLEANQIGWGASGRNGGFALISVGKNDLAAILRRHGVQEARRIFQLGRDAVRTVETVVADNGLEVDRSTRGWLCIAHKPSRMIDLKRKSELLAHAFDYETVLLHREDMASQFIGSQEAHGALYYPDGFGLHPLKYAHGLARAAICRGASIYTGSPVLRWSRERGRHVLHTPRGSLSAERVLVATGGYTLDQLHPWLAGRILPALSNILVTRALTIEEQRAAGLHTTIVASDTRKLVFYYRLLPDGRFLFGARGGLSDDERANRKAFAWLIRRMSDLFPALRNVEITHFWRGWVCLSRDKNPHIGTTSDESVYYALGYMGNGVALASHFGRIAAGRLAGARSGPIVELLDKNLPRFEFAAFRSSLLRLAYLGYGLRDAL